MTETNLVHYTVDGFGSLACSRNVNESGVWTVASEDRFDDVTCKDCVIGWLRYERDSYKEMFDNERAAVIERERENSALQEQYAKVVEENNLMKAGLWSPVPYAPYFVPRMPVLEPSVFAKLGRNTPGT